MRIQKEKSVHIRDIRGDKKNLSVVSVLSAGQKKVKVNAKVKVVLLLKRLLITQTAHYLKTSI